MTIFSIFDDLKTIVKQGKKRIDLPFRGKLYPQGYGDRDPSIPQDPLVRYSLFNAYEGPVIYLPERVRHLDNCRRDYWFPYV